MAVFGTHLQLKHKRLVHGLVAEADRAQSPCGLFTPCVHAAVNTCRTAGKTKRDNLDENEDLLLMKTLRDMNLSKLIAQDVPLFLSLLGDLFPAVVAGASGDAHAEVRIFPALLLLLPLMVMGMSLVLVYGSPAPSRRKKLRHPLAGSD